MFKDGPLTWRKSTYSSNQMSCVEVAFASGIVVTRDSKNPTGPVLYVGTGGWAAFLGRVKAGEFDLN
jgi:hypothetical protein